MKLLNVSSVVGRYINYSMYVILVFICFQGEPSRHQIVLHQHFDDLIRCLDAKGMLLLELLSRDVMDDIDRQVIKIERPVESRMNTKLIYWLARNNSSVYSIFLEALRATNQQHIANLLENKNGEDLQNISGTTLKLQG